jgi:para-nitrobenzyl esterase
MNEKKEYQGISRRTFLTNAAIAAFILSQQSVFAFAGSSRAIQGTPVLVKTPLGILRGEESEGVRFFRGIPFAEVPVGSLRFKQPVKIKSWTGEKDVTKFKASAMQTGEVGVAHSEDCLGLNVWAPVKKGNYPVFVWIHGGGFTGGHAFDSNGPAFTKDDVVVVTVPYRLGVFGFLDFSTLLGSGFDTSANNGIRDLIASLEWVRDNIASFGGDPNRVTIGGESAGGKLTDILMGIPAAQPLFHQMISSSGGAERVWSKKDADLAAKNFGDEWLKAGYKMPDLLTAPAEKITEVQQNYSNNWPKNIPQQIPMRPQIDGSLIPRLPIESIAAGLTKGKRLLIGSNLDESAMFIGPHPAKDATQDQLGNVTAERFAEIYSHYKTLYPHLNEEQLRIRAVSAQAYWVPSIRVADAHVKGGGTAWMYRLDFAESSGNYQGYAYHSLDVGMVWSKPHKDVANASAEAELSGKMHNAWVAFIHGKVPNAPGLPEWPQYKPASRETMILNSSSKIEQKPNEAELRLWDGLI